MLSLEILTRLLGFRKYVAEQVDWFSGWITIRLKRKPGPYVCPRCGEQYLVYHDRLGRFLRDLNLGRRKTLLDVPQYRLDCDGCGRQRERLPFARPGARATHRFEQLLFDLTADMTVKAVARRTQTNWKTVKEAEVRYIRGLLRKRKLDGIRRLGIDEVAERSGHRYLTLVTDLDEHRVIWVGPGRSRGTLGRYFRWFGPRRTRELRVVVIDMHDPYALEIAAQAPKAAIVYDRFHVMKHLNLAVDLVRRRLQRQMPAADRRVIKNKRYVILKARENLTSKERVGLKELLGANEEISTAYILKEDFREWFGCDSRTDARAYLRDWVAKVQESGIPELLQFAELLHRRRRGLRNYFQYKLTNSLSEGFNNVVKTIKKMAYGFHDSDYFRLKILRKCGKLETEDIDD